jgi:hypothetical protein
LPGATSARTDWMFGFQRRGVRRCECDTDIPKPGPLPQTSHTAATVDHSQRDEQTAGRTDTRSKTRGKSSRSALRMPPWVFEAFRRVPATLAGGGSVGVSG